MLAFTLVLCGVGQEVAEFSASTSVGKFLFDLVGRYRYGRGLGDRSCFLTGCENMLPNFELINHNRK